MEKYKLNEGFYLSFYKKEFSLLGDDIIIVKIIQKLRALEELPHLAPNIISQFTLPTLPKN